MKKHVMQKLVAALRSGEFKQGKHYLSRNGKNCCLGVLCELAPKNLNLEIDILKTDYTSEKNVKYFDGNKQYLPDKVVEWAGMSSDDGFFDSELLGTTLAEMNDSGKWSFTEIADFIEENYKQL